MFGLGSIGIGIDLGTTNTHVFIPNKGIVLREPSVVAKEKGSNEIIAFGKEARHMLGRTPPTITALCPMKRGVVADYDTTTSMIGCYLKKISTVFGRFGKKYSLIITVPTGSTAIEKQAIIDAARQAGASEAFTFEGVLAAAYGAGLPIWESAGNMVVDIGGGKTEAAVLSLNGIVTSESSKAAGQPMDEAIMRHIQKVHQLMIGAPTAEMIKIEIGSAVITNQGDREKKMNVGGRDLLTGRPVTRCIKAGEIEDALQESVKTIIANVKKALEKTPPEILADIMESGIVLTGGGALLKNLDKALSFATGIPVTIAANPADCVAHGTEMALDNLNLTRENSYVNG